MQNYFADTKTQFERHALAVSARAESKPTGIQEYAIDLYERGLNPFPIPSAYDWKLRGEKKKTPYKLEPLFRNRLHYVKGCGCYTCWRYNFVTLFENSNLAVMTGATSGNLLSVDCDSQEAFKSIGAELTRRGLPFWAFTSHKGGQYLLRVIEGEAANITGDKMADKFADVQVWGYRHFVVLPPSIHPKGTVYKWVTPEPLNMLPRETLPAVSVSALSWLGVTLKKTHKAEDDLTGLPEYAKNLSHASRHTLTHSVKQGGRNSALIALAADLAGIGLDEDEVESALRMAADNCSPVYDDRDHKIEPLVKWAFSTDRKPSRKYQVKVKQGIQEWQRAQAFASSFDWRAEFGGRSSYARRVFTACIERARLDSRDKVFRASVRDVAILANMNKGTVTDYLRLLVAHGLLEYTDNEKSGANVFRFGTSAISVQYYNIDILLYGNCTTQNGTLPDTDAERDAFNGLGIHAFSIWRGLLVEPAKNAYQIAKRLKLNLNTVKDTVKRLVLAGLVSYSQSEGLYSGNALTDSQLERIATDRGTQNKTSDKRAQFTTEREKYANRVIAEAKDWYKKQSAKMLRSL